jgi:hypothetical protein
MVGCGFLGLSCVGRFVQHHWRGIVQTGVFAGCLLASMGACLAIEAGGILIDYTANGIQYGFTSRQAWEPAVKSAVIDALTAPIGFGASRELERYIFWSSGLRAADSSITHGITGKLFGSYWSYIPRHSSDFVGYNQAVQFFAHPTPVLIQIGGRAGMNGLSCNGGHIMSYCL